MTTLNVSDKRQLLWDMALSERSSGITLKMHELVRKGPVLLCDEAWEGEHCCYGKIIFDGEKYRLYYRGCGANGGVWKTENGSHGVWCVAYSTDGKHFEKPLLGLHEYNGSKENNIVFTNEFGVVDNFSITLDTNPNCPENEKYKALMSYTKDREKNVNGLAYFTSADGLSFDRVGDINVEGAFDSMNILFWDENIGQYRLYFRGFHPLNDNYCIEYEKESHVRDVRLSLSDDMKTWSEPVLLDYGESDKLEIQLYTNNIQKYSRGDIFFGLPTRYIDRSPDMANFKHLPSVNGYRQSLIEKYGGRTGTAITETMFMVSHNGERFNRTREAFFTPGIESGDNWVYGDGYFVHGMIQTGSDFRGEPNELSLYVGHGYRARPVTFERYVIRLDGFFSWRADFEEGVAVTKPFVFEGNALEINFSTSALGFLRIELLDENGNAIEGYDSGRIFGNSVNRPCEFEGSLSDLSGKEVRLRLTMRDCDLYSFKFSKK